jgi:hypothetical protein
MSHIDSVARIEMSDIGIITIAIAALVWQQKKHSSTFDCSLPNPYRTVIYCQNDGATVATRR